MFLIHFFLTAMCQARIYSLCYFKNSDGLYFFPANWLLLIVIDGQIRTEKQLWILCSAFWKIPITTSTVKFSVKLQSTSRGFISSSRLNFSPNFQNTEKRFLGWSCSAFINAVMKYLNFWFKVRERYMQSLLKIALRHSNFSKNLNITAEQRYWKMHPDGCFWWQLYFGNFPDSCFSKTAANIYISQKF